MLNFTIATNLIKEAMPVVCSEGGQFAVVDHLEGTDTIKLTRDADGRHHYIPLAWVTSVDDKVHLDRPGEQAMAEWKTTPPQNPDAEPTVAEAPHYINSVDATMGQPIVARVMARKQELEAALEALPTEDVRARADLELVLGTIGELLTGDLENVPPVVVATMSRWLENNKHLAESAIAPASNAMAALDPTVGRAHPVPASLSRL